MICVKCDIHIYLNHLHRIIICTVNYIYIYLLNCLCEFVENNIAWANIDPCFASADLRLPFLGGFSVLAMNNRERHNSCISNTFTFCPCELP